MTRNPIYQALLRTRMIYVMMREFEKSPGSAALLAQHRNEMGVLRALSERGVIPVSVDREIRLGAARSIHAAAINHWRKQSRLIDRRRMPRMLKDAETHRVRF